MGGEEKPEATRLRVVVNLTLSGTTPGDQPCTQTSLSNTQDPKNQTPVIVAGKDQGEVDNDYFLIPVPISDHQGPLENAFPVENRLLGQGAGRGWLCVGSGLDFPLSAQFGGNNYAHPAPDRQSGAADTSAGAEREAVCGAHRRLPPPALPRSAAEL